MKKKLLILLFSFSTVSIGFWGDDESLKTKKSVDPMPASAKAHYELAVCSVNTKVKKNPAYYHLPSVNTKLLCDVSANTRIGTFEAFYNDGWRLIQVVNIDNRLVTKDKTVPYSLIYLERLKIVK